MSLSATSSFISILQLQFQSGGRDAVSSPVPAGLTLTLPHWLMVESVRGPGQACLGQPSHWPVTREIPCPWKQRRGQERGRGWCQTRPDNLPRTAVTLLQRGRTIYHAALQHAALSLWLIKPSEATREKQKKNNWSFSITPSIIPLVNSYLLF